MRPLYESEADLSREAKVMERLSKLWRCSFHKLPIRYHLDYAAVRNKRVVGYVEVKVRNYSMEQIDRMGGYMLSLGKMQAGQSLSSLSKVPICLVVQCTDATYWLAVKDFSEFPVTITGRTDRGDAQDVEPCVLIPKARFKILS